jgi:hypothetical protein
MPSERDSFYLEEYKSIRNEMLLRVQQRFTVQTLVLAASGALYGIAATTSKLQIEQDIKKFIPILWWVPFGLVLVAAGYFALFARLMTWLGEYSKKLESHFLGARQQQEPEGWEHFFENKSHWSIGHSWFWILLFLITLAVPLIATVRSLSVLVFG